MAVLPGAVSADTVEQIVRANQRTAVGGVFVYGIGSCRAGPIADVTVREKPRNGTLAVHVVAVTLDNATNCAGHKVSGPALVYTPNKGFRGTDQFTIDYPFASNESRPATLMSRTYQLRVE